MILYGGTVAGEIRTLIHKDSLEAQSAQSSQKLVCAPPSVIVVGLFSERGSALQPVLRHSACAAPS